MRLDTNELISVVDKSLLAKFDSWRGILSLFVGIGHGITIFFYPLYGSDNLVMYCATALAHVAVVAFFVLSGFLISYSLINGSRYAKSGTVGAKRYLISRFSRIYPPLIFSFLICYGVKYFLQFFNLPGFEESFFLEGDKSLVREYFRFGRYEVIDYLLMWKSTMLVVNGPLWSLIIEWWLYIFALGIAGIYFSKKLFVKLIYVVVTIFGLYKLFDVNSFAGHYLAMWLLGLFALLFYSKIKSYIYFLLGSIGFVYFGFVEGVLVSLDDIALSSGLELSFAMIFIGIMKLLPVSNLLKKLGDSSYTFYIIHFPIFIAIFTFARKFIGRDFNTMLVVAIVTYVLTVLIAYYSAKVLENKKLFSSKLSKLFKK